MCVNVSSSLADDSDSDAAPDRGAKAVRLGLLPGYYTAVPWFSSNNADWRVTISVEVVRSKQTSKLGRWKLSRR